MRDNCDDCADTGLVIRERVYRCHCEKGNQHPAEIFSSMDKEKKFPIKIPRLPGFQVHKSGRELAVGEKDD